LLFLALLIVGSPRLCAQHTSQRIPSSQTQPRDGTELLERIQAAFTGLVDRVGPAVVAIQADRRAAGLGENEQGAMESWSSNGSGVIIRRDGMILTSQHVIDAAVTIHVTLYDGRRLAARPIAADRRSDLAIIRINADALNIAQLGDARDVRRGHLVFALGNPLGLSSDGQAAVSHGLVSAIGRPLPETFGREEDRYYGDMIQITAPIHPGNSGGPLVDIYGRIIGIIAAVGTQTGAQDGIGFAVPIDERTRAIIEKLLHGQRVAYGYLGVQVDRLTEPLRRRAGLPPSQGVLIDSVFPGGPADHAGLRGGDIVLRVDGRPIRSVEQFVRTIGAAGPHRRVKLTYVRGAKRHVVGVTLVQRPANTVEPLPEATLSFRGAALGEVEPAMRAMANLPANALLVLTVQDDTPADRAGLTPGDIIIRIQGNPVSKGSLEAASAGGGDVLVGLANGRSVLVREE